MSGIRVTVRFRVRKGELSSDLVESEHGLDDRARYSPDRNAVSEFYFHGIDRITGIEPSSGET